ncbi:transcriptional regulator [Campylobacterota bacterium]|nr:transcriptional regulator [Campylobacterota bacterium]
MGDKTIEIERLQEIARRLHAGEELHAPSLAEEFGVSERTIQRDLYERLDKTIRAKLEKCERTVWLPSALSDEEQATVAALKTLAANVGEEFARRSNHLLAQLGRSSEKPFYARLGMEKIDAMTRKVALIERAIANHQALTVRYRNAAARTVYPVYIVCFEGLWYLITQGDVASGEDVYRYRLKQLSDIALKNEFFKPIRSIKRAIERAISIYFRPFAPPQTVLLHIAEGAKYYFQTKPLPTQRIIGELDDGSIEIEVQITNEMEIIPIVQYWLPHIRVISPDSIAEKVRQNITAWLEPMKL